MERKRVSQYIIHCLHDTMDHRCLDPATLMTHPSRLQIWPQCTEGKTLIMIFEHSTLVLIRLGCMWYLTTYGNDEWPIPIQALTWPRAETCVDAPLWHHQAGLMGFNDLARSRPLRTFRFSRNVQGLFRAHLFNNLTCPFKVGRGVSTCVLFPAIELGRCNLRHPFFHYFIAVFSHQASNLTDLGLSVNTTAPCEVNMSQ